MHFQHWKIFSSESNCCIKHPQNSSKTYLFYGTLFILWKKSEVCNLLLSKLYSQGWSIQHDKELKSNLRKSPKLSYLALHPGNNKQNVPLALQTTITAARSYFPNWRDVNSFLEIFNNCWTISKSKQRFSPNVLRNAVISGDKKLIF